MKRLTVSAAIFLMLCTAKGWAATQIVTIYFAGTSADSQWSSPHKTAWRNHEELLAALFSQHQLLPAHHKWFVDGIGSGCSDKKGGFSGDISGGLGDLFGAGFPGLDVCRGWHTNLRDAAGFLENIIAQYPDDDIILNLPGWSRGGALAMWFASEQNSNNTIKRINILAFDPVIGDLIEMKNKHHYILGSKVAHYVGLYAENERSFMFAPTLPGYDSRKTEVWMFRLPGSHETLVGNLQKTGHSIITACYLLETGCPLSLFSHSYPDTEPALEDVYWVTRAFAEKLLGTPGWGGVKFSWNGYAESEATRGRREVFGEKLDSMWNNPDIDYQYMQSWAFTGFLEDHGGLFSCYAFNIFATGQSDDRCSIDYSSGAAIPGSSLMQKTTRLTAADWDRFEHH